MLQAVLIWAGSTCTDHPEAVQQLLQQCLRLAASPNREVRLAVAQEAPALAQPQLLKALYSHTSPSSSSGSDTANLEAKLLQVGHNNILPLDASHT